MTRHVFFSFHYDEDNWRAAQVRSIHNIDGNKPAHDNDWEAVKRGGDRVIEKWIKDQMKGRSCIIVLIGSHTAGRKWIDYEIREGWNEGKGVFGIYINGLHDKDEKPSVRGRNPFDDIKLNNGSSLASIVPVHTPTGDSKAIYREIADNMETWIEEAIKIRKP